MIVVGGGDEVEQQIHLKCRERGGRGGGGRVRVKMRVRMMVARDNADSKNDNI